MRIYLPLAVIACFCFSCATVISSRKSDGALILAKNIEEHPASISALIEGNTIRVISTNVRDLALTTQVPDTNSDVLVYLSTEDDPLGRIVYRGVIPVSNTLFLYNQGVRSSVGMREAGSVAESTSAVVPEQNSQQPASNYSSSSAPDNPGAQTNTNAMQQKNESMTIAGKITDGNKPTSATVSIYKVTEDGMQPVMKDVPFSGSYSISVPSDGEYSIVAKSSDGTISTKDVTTVSAKPENATSTDISTKPLKAGESMTFRSILFDTDKWSIRRESNPILDDIAAFLTAQPSVTIEIAGHTDNRASEEYNTKLSLKRAESIRSYLVGKGIKANRLSVKGYGAAKPVAENTSLRGMYLNRRVEFLILTR